MGYAFISYSSKNQDAGDKMRSILNENGIESWMAPYDIPVGSKYAKVINMAIKNCSCLVLLLTDHAQNSVWVAKEVERAINYRKPLFPIQLESVVLNDEFELYISSDQTVEIKDLKNDSPDVHRLTDSIAIITGRTLKATRDEKTESTGNFVIDSTASAPTPVTAPDAPRLRTDNYQKAPSYDSLGYKLPPTEIIHSSEFITNRDIFTDQEIKDKGDAILATLDSFGIKAVIDSVDVSARLIRFAIIPKAGTRMSQIEKLEDDIRFTLGSDSVRIQAPIPGRSAIGIEVVRNNPRVIKLREMLETDEFMRSSETSFCLGQSVENKSVICDITKMPHLLISGAFGSGKTVCLSSIITSILFKARPDAVKFIMIDPRQVDLSIYTGIPHLLLPVIKDAKHAAAALVWSIKEMERRYGLLASTATRSVDAYNEKVIKNPELGECLPKIIIVINELGDLMLGSKDTIEPLLVTLAQKSRAAGIHMVIGTQRPSSNVITGVIKANIPSRIAFRVSSYVDSRLIIEHGGAEKLMNNGDMLYSGADSPNPVRMQGVFIADDEIENVVCYLKAQVNGTLYDKDAMGFIDGYLDSLFDAKKDGSNEDSEKITDNPRFRLAVEAAITAKSASASLLQRKLSIGFSKANEYLSAMEAMGIVGPAKGGRGRDVLFTLEDWKHMIGE